MESNVTANTPTTERVPDRVQGRLAAIEMFQRALRYGGDGVTGRTFRAAMLRDDEAQAGGVPVIDSHGLFAGVGTLPAQPRDNGPPCSKTPQVRPPIPQGLGHARDHRLRPPHCSSSRSHEPLNPVFWPLLELSGSEIRRNDGLAAR